MPRKLSAHYIHPGHGTLLRNAILILDDNGRILDLQHSPNKDVKEIPGLEFYSGIITPGFINTHCHLELSHMKGIIPEGTGMAEFIRSVVTRRKSGQEEIEKAMRRADLEMQKEGIVAVGDVCNREDSFGLKSESPIIYHSFIELFGMVNSLAPEIFEKGTRLLKKALNEYNLLASLVPHSAYATSEELYRLFRENCNTEENIFSVHNQESEHEDDFIRSLKGSLYELYRDMGSEKGDSRARNVSPLEYIVQSLPSVPKRLLIHNVFTSEEDLRKASPDPDKTFWTLCPGSNKYINGNLPGSLLIKKYPTQVCIGTDSLASNTRLSVLHELYLLQEAHPDISLDTLLQMACLNGARALNLDKTLGSFEKGKRPGINLITNANLSNLRLTADSRVKVLH